MIKRIKKCSDVVFGSGTVSIGLDTTGLVECIYNKPKSLVGGDYNKDSGKNTIELDTECVCLRFDTGKDALMALDILIGNLQEIKNNLTNERTKKDER